MDSSALSSFPQIRRLAQENGVEMILVGVPPAQQRSVGFAVRGTTCFGTLDGALEHCENHIIDRYAERAAEAPDFRAWLARTFGRLQADEPRLGQAMPTVFMAVTADRLRFSTRLVSVLQR